MLNDFDYLSVKEISGIYCIKNIINDKKYVGATLDFKVRLKTHYRKLKKQKHFNKHLQNSFNKYGEENFKFIILEKNENPEDIVNKEKM